MNENEAPCPHVLVLEDEPLLSELLQDWLTELGCRTVGPATSVKGALGLIEAEPLDGAILDVSLRGEDSYSVAEALAERGVPFAFATGLGTPGLADRFPNVLILRKPFRFDDVRAAIGAFADPCRRAPARSYRKPHSH